MLAAEMRAYEQLPEPPVPDGRVVAIQTHGLASPLGQEAFASMYESYGPEVAKVCRDMIYKAGLPDPFHTAENTIQDTWLGAVAALGEGRFQAERPVAPWLSTIARRRCLDAMRSYGTRRRPATVYAPDQLAVDVVNDTMPRTTDPHLLLETLDLLAAVPAEQRRSLVANSLGERDTEIAAHDNVPLGTVKSRIRNGRRAARTLKAQADAADVAE